MNKTAKMKMDNLIASSRSVMIQRPSNSIPESQPKVMRIRKKGPQILTGPSLPSLSPIASIQSPQVEESSSSPISDPKNDICVIPTRKATRPTKMKNTIPRNKTKELTPTSNRMFSPISEEEDFSPVPKRCPNLSEDSESENEAPIPTKEQNLQAYKDLTKEQTLQAYKDLEVSESEEETDVQPEEAAMPSPATNFSVVSGRELSKSPRVDARAPKGVHSKNVKRTSLSFDDKVVSSINKLSNLSLQVPPKDSDNDAKRQKKDDSLSNPFSSPLKVSSLPAQKSPKIVGRLVKVGFTGMTEKFSKVLDLKNLAKNLSPSKRSVVHLYTPFILPYREYEEHVFDRKEAEKQKHLYSKKPNHRKEN